MALPKMDDFSFKFVDVPGNALNTTPDDAKDKLDSQPRAIRNFLNNNLIPGIASKEDLANIVVGQLPEGSITDAMLSDATGQIKARVEELFTSVSNGKTSIATAITNMGVTASPTDAFALLAEKIGQIFTGKKFATGTTTSSSSSLPFVRSYGTSNNLSYFNIIGLGFIPEFIISISESPADSSPYFTLYRATDFIGSSTVQQTKVISGSFQTESGGTDGTLWGYKLSTNCYVSETAIQLPASSFLNIPIRWYAIGK